jgi:adenylate cyclase
MLSPKAKRNISRIIPFGLIWFVSGLVFFIVEKAAIGDSDYAPTAIRINFEIFMFASMATTCFGLLLGTIEVLYLDKVFVKKSLD